MTKKSAIIISVILVIILGTLFYCERKNPEAGSAWRKSEACITGEVVYA